MDANLRHFRTRRRAAIVFFVAVLIFALCYWVIWDAHPDYFVVSGQANVRPLAAAQDLLWSRTAATSESWESAGLEDLGKRLRPVLQGLYELPAKERELKKENDLLQAQFDAAYSRAGEGAAERIKQFKTSQLHDLEAQSAIIQADIASLERATLTVSDPIAASHLRVAISNRQVDRAKHEVVVTQKRAEVEDYISRRYGTFISPADHAQIENLRAASDRNLKSQVALANRYVTLRSQLDSMVSEETEKLRHRLNFLDFIYFSFGVSTTVTFGDIIPNHWLIRAIVTVQLLISIIVVGSFVNSLAAR